MRLALNVYTLIPALALATACGGDTGETAPGRKSAAGEVLGGEVTDDMLPLDTARSTSPAGRSGPAEDDAAADEAPTPPRIPEERRAVLPAPQVSGGPEPYLPGATEDAPSPEPTAE